MPNFWRYWEKDGNTDRYRKYCRRWTPSNAFVTLTGFSTSQIGEVYTLGTASSQVSYLRGVDHSYAWENLVPQEVIYPTPIINNDGGWKYSPLNPGLPASIKAPAGTYELAVDVVFTIVSATTSYPQTCVVKIEDVILDDRDTTFYLSDVIVGDGTAFSRSLNNIRGYDWRVFYGASYKSNWELDDTIPASRVVQLIYPLGLSEGTYHAKDLSTTTYANIRPSCTFSSGMVVNNNKNNERNYVPPSELILSALPFWNGVIFTVPGVCYY